MKRFTCPECGHVGQASEESQLAACPKCERIVREFLPADYEQCGDCGFDHSYEYESAHAWHANNPGSYD